MVILLSIGIFGALALAACAPSLSAVKCTKLAGLARDAGRVCQQHGNLSEENWPLMPQADGACVHLAQSVTGECR